MKMKTVTFRQVLAVGGAAFLAFMSPAAAAIYIKMEGIPGEITGGRFKGWSEITRASTSTIPSAVVGAAPDISYSITKVLDRASPLLFLRCASGIVVPRITLLWESEGGVAYRVRCDNVRITGIHADGKQTPPIPTETVSFNFQKIEWSCIALDPDGTDSGALIADFDLVTLASGLKPRLPFRADFGPGAGRGSLLLSCPVTRGHRYRLLSNAGLGKDWQTVTEFTAEQDGTYQREIPTSPTRVFLKLEEVD